MSPLVVPFLVFYALLTLAMPILVVALYVRCARLRARLMAAEEEAAEQMASVRRELLDLKKSIAAAQERVAKPGTVATEGRPAPAPVFETAPKPKAPAAVPVVSPQVVPIPLVDVDPTSSPVAPPPVPATRHTEPESPAIMARSVTARIGSAESSATALTFRAPVPKPTIREQINRVSALEETLGTNWLQKLGIVLLVFGIASFGIYELAALGSLGKVLVSYFTAAFLLVGGVFLERRERYRLLGRAGIGGGWALLFFTTYAMYHVTSMRVLNSLVLDSVFMLVIAAAMAGHTLRYKSQFVAGLAFLLGYSTVALSHDTVYSLWAGVILAIGLVAIVLKMRWYELEVFGVLSSYLNHLYWLYRLLGGDGAHGRAFPEYHASAALVLFYWVTFRVSYVVRRISTDREESVSTAAAVLNTLLLLALMKFQSVQPQLAYLALLFVGTVELACALLPVTRKRRQAFVVLSVMGSALILASVPSHYSGNSVALLWLVGAEVFLIAGIAAKEIVFRRIGLVAGLIVGVHLVYTDFRAVLDERQSAEMRLLGPAVLFGACAFAFYANNLGILRKWSELFEANLDGRLLAYHSYLGALSAAAGAWAFFTKDWTALALAVLMVIVAALGRILNAPHLQPQYAFLGALAAYRMYAFNLHLEEGQASHILTRLVTLPLIAAAFYGTARFAALSDTAAQRAFRACFVGIGTSTLALLIWLEVPTQWVAVGWIGFSVVLMMLGRRLSYTQLTWQANVLAVCATLQVIFVDFDVEQRIWPGIALRIVTVSLVAAGIYFLSRKGSPSNDLRRIVAFVHSFAATGLLAALIFYQAPNGWLAPLWAAFALILGLIDRKWECEDLPWQVHALALLALVRAFSFNLHDTAVWHDWSVRLLSLSLLSVISYSIACIIRIPHKWRERDVHHSYSWAASVLVSLLLWYELQPLSVAVGWAVFGLVLFEYDFLRKITQFRYQAYIALVAAFTRIFFVNLTAGEPGQFWGPRLYTVVPLVMILFLMYAQFPDADASKEDKGAGRERVWHVDDVLACMGTAAIVALLRFQFLGEWVVTAWAALTLVIFCAAWLLKREVFLYQGAVLIVLSFTRGLAHNLFGRSYFAEGDWTGRYLVVGISVALLLVNLAVAFPLRERYRSAERRNGVIGTVLALARRPEQLTFFAPVVLLSLMLALKMRAGMVTVSWGIEALFIIVLALAVKERSFRLTGLALLLLCVVKIMAMDAWGLQARDRYLTLIIVGSALLLVSFLYSRYRETIRQFL